MEEKEWELYMSRKFAIMDYNTGMLQAEENGLKKGRKEGKKKKQIEIAKKLLDKDMSIEEIQEITELTKEEIQKL